MAETNGADQNYEFKASDGEIFLFANRNDAYQYAVAERPKWNWLTQFNTTREFNGAMSSLHQICASLDTAVAAPREELGQGPRPDDPLCRGLTEYLNWAPAIHSRAPLQAFILKIASRNAREGIWTLGWLIHRAGKAPNFDNIAAQYANTPGVFTGLASAWQWDGLALVNDLAHQTLTGVQQVASTVNLMRDQTAATLNSAQSSSAELSGIAGAGRTTLQNSTAELNEFSAAMSSRLDEVINEHGSTLESEWREITKTYSESLKLKAPAQYWGTKQTKHRAQSFWYALAATIFAVLGGAGLCFAYARLLGTTPAGTMLPPLGELLQCVVLAVVFLWVLRTLMRLTMSHVHLALDAEEREVMVQCYLAMTNEGKTSGDERGALFAAIFRPTGDGLVKDESPPIPMWEMLKAAKPKAD